jgi:hypothetical protein
MVLMEDVMEVVQVVGKGHFMNLLEKFYVYKETPVNKQLNNKSSVGCSRIFKTVIQQSHPR